MKSIHPNDCISAYLLMFTSTNNKEIIYIAPSSSCSYLVVGSHVDGDRQALVRFDPSQSGVQGQFSHRDTHPTCTQISQT